ncbi:GntR family transcriptional regulator [Bacteroidales bacterium OttesenSCG-928-I21]|nr:GntR family transcriptional regulator [Bacteroidales bacterium OttesenSCG-928-I21]
MIKLGKTNKLKVLNVDGDLISFDAEEFGQINVTNNDFVLKYNVGDTVNVFLYPEADVVKGFIGTPYVELNEFANLEVIAKTKIGDFFDWGIDKDLFCPFKEQKSDLLLNHHYLVFVYLDESTNRIAASTKIGKFFCDEKPEFAEGEEVAIIIINKSQIGYNAIVENKFKGLLYDNEVFSELESGQKLKAIVKKVREDNKIDIRLFKNNHEDIERFEKQILNYLKSHGGEMNITDESSPETIYDAFGFSKKNFKKALGALYRKGIVDLKGKTIKLLKN